MSPPYLLDTNLIVHYVRNDALWASVRDTYNLFVTDPVPSVSVVTHGELWSLSRRWKWGPRRLERLLFALGYFRKVTIDIPAIVDIYATIESDCRSRGFKLGKNDLWIAATAVATDSTVLTTDKDFGHVNPSMLSCILVGSTAHRPPAGGP